MTLGDPCPCFGNHHTADRLMRGCLLLLLSEERGHGYGLMEKLSRFGFRHGQISAGTLYQSLRNMEKQGAAASVWISGGQGPRRRVYAITDDGRKELEEWMGILKDRKARIEALMGEYERIAGKPSGPPVTTGETPSE